MGPLACCCGGSPEIEHEEEDFVHSRGPVVMKE